MLQILKIAVFLASVHVGRSQYIRFTQYDDGQCILHRYIGKCVPISECPSIFDFLQKGPITPTASRILRQAHCGFDGKIPKICCLSTTQAQEIHTTTTSTTTTPEPVRVQDNVLVQPIQTKSREGLFPDVETCGVSTNDRIFGGEVADIDEFPWMALLNYRYPRGHGFYCGGVLINRNYILTAAHCVAGKEIPKNWKIDSVRLGDYNTDNKTDCVFVAHMKEKFCADPPLDVKVEEAIVHELYDPNSLDQLHDIALLRLGSHVPYTDFIKPICLPLDKRQRTKSYAGNTVFVAGWGATERGDYSNIKLKLRLPVSQDNQCATTYRTSNIHLNANYQMCAGGLKGKDSCTGDSGGPLMAFNPDKNNEGFNWYSIGVVSFGPVKCGLPGWPGVYTRTSAYIDWILSKVRP